MTRRAQILLGLAILAPLLAFACAWTFAPPLLNTDSATGFLVWQDMARGAPWNSLLAPDFADLARDRAEFLSWWSPGQYVFPGLLHSLGLTWCRAALLVTLASAWLGGAGVWLLGRRLGLDEDQRSLACLLVTVAGGALHGFGMFWGGDILMLAAAPLVYWSALGLRARGGNAFAGATIFFAASLLALFCKHGATLAIAGSLGFLLLESLSETGTRLPGRRFWLAVAAAALAYLCSRLLWVRGGPTPADAAQVSHPWLASLSFSLNGPWLALSGAGNLASWVTQLIAVDTEERARLLGWLLLPFIAMSALLLRRWLRMDARPAERLAAAAWLAAFALLAFLYLRGASVSFEERHFRPVVTPLALALAAAAVPGARRRPDTQPLAILFVGLSLFLSVVAHVRRVHLVDRLPIGPVTGFAQPNLDPGSWRALRDELPPEAVWVLPSPVHALEFANPRLLSTDALFRSDGDLARWRFAGPGVRLAVAVPTFFEADGRGARLRAAFVDVAPDAWHPSRAGNWILWTVRPSSPVKP